MRAEGVVRVSKVPALTLGDERSVMIGALFSTSLWLPDCPPRAESRGAATHDRRSRRRRPYNCERHVLVRHLPNEAPRTVAHLVSLVSAHL